MSEKKEQEKIDKEMILRHSTAHVLDMALLEVFPETRLAVGPPTSEGFYQDFDISRTIVPEDLEVLEEKMKEIIKANYSFENYTISADKALEKYKALGQKYKVELIEDLKKKGIKDVSIYKTNDYVDLCSGPHLDSTGEVNAKAFKLTKFSGAYWKGDEKREQLQRIYGVVFNDKKQLKQYLFQQEEAKKRDHRKIGKELGLFVFSDTVGKGLPLWTPKGAVVRRELERFIVDEEIKRGYLHVYTPDIAKIDLYKKSGHYPYYKDSMYAPITIEDEEFLLRPMTCPHHFELYLSEKRSYKELPMRIAELAKLYRFEKSGELNGLIRVRSFCLADAHIVCRKNQAKSEIDDALELIDDIAKIFGLKAGENYRYRLSLGNREDDKKYYKDDEAWDFAENILREVLNERNAVFFEEKDEAAFYGPKIDIQMKNVNGKEDTAFTVQYDFVMPKRFNLEFINEEGGKEEPVVIHRSSVGAIERVVAFLIEHYAGALPTWLAPTQVVIVPVSEKFNDYAEEVREKLFEKNIRVEADTRDESLGKRIREAEKQKVPYILVVGEKEVNDKTVAVRARDNKENKQEIVELDGFVENILEEVLERK